MYHKKKRGKKSRLRRSRNDRALSGREGVDIKDIETGCRVQGSCKSAMTLEDSLIHRVLVSHLLRAWFTGLVRW